jgi:acyl-CoA synthetase (AMP-forming)/AMP-acid ligase II
MTALASLHRDSFSLALFRHADQPTGSTIRFMNRGNTVAELDYARLALLAGGVAHRLGRAGIGPRDRVAVVMATSLPVIATVSALFAIGAALLPLVHRHRLNPGSYQSRTLALSLRAVQPHCVLVPAAMADVYLPTLVEAGISKWLCLEELIGEERAPPCRSAGDDPRIIQFSSGTTSRPKAIELGEEQLISNVKAIIERTDVSTADHLYSWLPLFHDMGLISVLTALYAGSSMTLTPSVDFVRNPLGWPQAMSRNRCTLTLGPPKAFELLAAKAKTNFTLVKSIDLSSLRLAMTGAEMVPPGLGRDFQDAFFTCNLRDDVLQPCYGLAENTVAVTLRPPGQPWSIAHFSRAALHESRVELLSSTGPASISRVGNGRPVAGTDIVIGRAHGSSVELCAVGELYIRGTSAATAIIGHDGMPQTTFDGGWIATGDVAIQLNDELFIVGRIKELVKYAGQSFSLIDIERVIADASHLTSDGVAAVPIFDELPNRESLVIFIETPTSTDSDLITAARQAVLAAFQMPVQDVVLLPRGGLPRTSSGKVKRAALVSLYRGLHNEAEGHVGMPLLSVVDRAAA